MAATLAFLVSIYYLELIGSTLALFVEVTLSLLFILNMHSYNRTISYPAAGEPPNRASPSPLTWLSRIDPDGLIIHGAVFLFNPSVFTLW